jgi:hypothetical protein
MRRPLVIPVLLAAVIMAGCSERVTQQSTMKVDGGTIASVISDDSLRTLIGVLFFEADAPTAQFDQMLGLLRRTEPPPDLPGAQALAAEIVNLTIGLFKSGGLKNPTDPNLPQNVLTFGNGILELVGLPPGLTLAALDPDGAAAVITPESPNTTVLTETKFAGVQVNTGQVPQTTLITVTRLPNSPPPLLTTLAQFPFFYEYTSAPEVTFNTDVVVGVCQPNNIVIPNPSRLRLAHNIAPFTPGSIEILPLVNAPFLDCTLAQFSRAGFAAPLLKDLAALVTPTPLYASGNRWTRRQCEEIQPLWRGGYSGHPGRQVAPESDGDCGREAGPDDQAPQGAAPECSGGADVRRHRGVQCDSGRRQRDRGNSGHQCQRSCYSRWVDDGPWRESTRSPPRRSCRRAPLC